MELPNAPVMLSGIRIATAINVGTAPLAFLIGASSYGELIFPGIYLNDFPTLIRRGGHRAVCPDPRHPAGCAGSRDESPSRSITITRSFHETDIQHDGAVCRGALHQPVIAAPLILATKSFTEQHILSAMTVQYLQRKGSVQPQTNIATVISRNAMINKQIDMTGSTPVRR